MEADWDRPEDTGPNSAWLIHAPSRLGGGISHVISGVHLPRSLPDLQWDFKFYWLRGWDT